MSSSFEKNTITSTTALDSNTENYAVNMLQKQADFYHGAAFMSLMLWMVMGWLYFPMNTILVAENAVANVLTFCAELLLITYVLL